MGDARQRRSPAAAGRSPSSPRPPARSCRGPPSCSGLSDLVVMSAEAVAFVSGPQMVAEFTGIRIGLRELGGTGTTATSSGLCAVESDDVDGAVAELLEYLPSNTDELPPQSPGQRLGAAPDAGTAHASSRTARRRPTTSGTWSDPLGDDGEFRELWPRWAGQLVTAFARLGGMPVGVVANQPRILAGTLDIAASQKAARFVRLCDAFNLPIVSLVDTPGFLPGQGPRVAGDDPTRRRVGLRLRPGDRAAPVPHPAQGVRRRLHRHGFSGRRQRPVPGLARGRGGRHGRIRRGADPPPAAGPVRADRPRVGLRGGLPQPLAGGRTGARRPGHRPGRHPAGPVRRRCASCARNGSWSWAASTMPARNSGCDLGICEMSSIRNEAEVHFVADRR